MFRPVPEFIAAVIPTTRGSRSHSRTSASPNTCVYCGAGRGALPLLAFAAAVASGGLGAGWVGTPFKIDFGFAACHFSIPSRPPSSAGAKPLPFTVAMCTTTGRCAASASRSATRSARTSWPSITPMYAQSSSSHQRPGAQNAFSDSFSCGPSFSNAAPTAPGRRVRPPSTPSRACQSFGFRRTRLKYRESAPTFGAIDIPLSLSTTTIGVPSPPAWPIASNATPPVIAPSPITATTLPWSPRPRWRMPSLIPTAYPTDVEAWPAPMMSCGDSSLEQNGARPSYWRIVCSRSRRPVSTLWGYAWWPTSQRILSLGESSSECSATASSHVPRFAPKCPPISPTVSMMCSRTSCANCCSSSSERSCRSSGPSIRSIRLMRCACR